jgi:O-antigen ligase
MKLSYEKLLKWSLFLLIFSIPFCVRKFLFAFPMPFGNEYTTEYASAFLYGSDILLFIFMFLFFMRVRLAEFFEWVRGLGKTILFLALFLCISALSLLLAVNHGYAVYSLLRLILVASMALAIGFLARKKLVSLRNILCTLAVSAVCESVFGILQFVWQKSIGLRLLGEMVSGPGAKGIGTVVVNGTEFIRAYGTMPHSNILAAFLVLGLLSLFYLFLREGRLCLRVLEVAGIFIVLAGIFLTFSRSGWIIGAVGAFIVLLFGFWDVATRKRARELTFVFLLSLVLLLFAVGWAIFPRAHLSSNEGSVRDRWDYNRIGFALIASHPLGVGIGNELLYSYRSGFLSLYGLSRLEQWQPIHNLYLLIGSEIGLLGVISFVVLIAFLLFYKNRSFESRFSKTLLFVLLLSGLFDHFLWDMQLGRLMFWVVLGILIGTDVGPHSTTDSV